MLGFWGVDLLEAVAEAVCNLWGSPSPCEAIPRLFLLLSVIDVSKEKDLEYHPERGRIHKLRESLVVNAGRALLMMSRRCCSRVSYPHVAERVCCL